MEDWAEIHRLHRAEDMPIKAIVREPGDSAQMDLWFPVPLIPVGFGQVVMLPVLVMTLTYSRFLAAVMLPSRQVGPLRVIRAPDNGDDELAGWRA